MQAKITKLSDSLTPDLARLYRNAADRAGLHQAVGLRLQGLAKQAFNDASKRPAAWPAKKDGAPATLKASSTLWHSIRTDSNAAQVRVGSDRHYAAIHQLGGRTRPHVIRPKSKKALKIPGIGPRAKVNHPGSDIPARPYLPFDAAGRPTPEAAALIQAIARARLMRGVKGA